MHPTGDDDSAVFPNPTIHSIRLGPTTATIMLFHSHGYPPPLAAFERISPRSTLTFNIPGGMMSKPTDCEIFHFDDGTWYSNTKKDGKWNTTWSNPPPTNPAHYVYNYANPGCCTT